MGYTTEFSGEFVLNTELDATTYALLVKLQETRRMARRLPNEYGIEGEFFVDGTGLCGQDRSSDIIDYNRPPSTQPSLWCDWIPTDDRKSIVWNGSEKFYSYTEWIKYIIANILAPKGYVLNGTMIWQGEDIGDAGRIIITDNVVKTQVATFKDVE